MARAKLRLAVWLAQHPFHQTPAKTPSEMSGEMSGNGQDISQPFQCAGEISWLIDIKTCPPVYPRPGKVLKEGFQVFTSIESLPVRDLSPTPVKIHCLV